MQSVVLDSKTQRRTFTGRLLCFFGRHDWEVLQPTEEQEEDYRKFYYRAEYDNTVHGGDDDGWIGPYIFNASRDRVCIRAGCKKTDLPFTRLLMEGRIRWEEDERMRPIIERERELHAQEMMRERARAEFQRREREIIARQVYAEKFSKEVSHVRRKFEPKVIRGTSVLIDKTPTIRKRGR